MENLEEKIKKAIEADLPKQVGDILKERLEKADKLEKENVALKKEIENANSDTASLTAKISAYQEFDARNEALTTREKAVEEKEKTIEVDALKIKLEEANKRADMVQGFTASLVRNTTFRKNIMDSEGGMGYNGARDQHGNPVYANTTKTYSETEAAE